MQSNQVYEKINIKIRFSNIVKIKNLPTLVTVFNFIPFNVTEGVTDFYKMNMYFTTWQLLHDRRWKYFWDWYVVGLIAGADEYTS